VISQFEQDYIIRLVWCKYQEERDDYMTTCKKHLGLTSPKGRTSVMEIQFVACCEGKRA
jgi:hypothetical protein